MGCVLFAKLSYEFGLIERGFLSATILGNVAGPEAIGRSSRRAFQFTRFLPWESF
jgi:hypothetical protein